MKYSLSNLTSIYVKLCYVTVVFYILYFYTITNWLQLVTVTSNSDLDACKCISLIMWCCFLWGFHTRYVTLLQKSRSYNHKKYRLGFLLIATEIYQQLLFVYYNLWDLNTIWFCFYSIHLPRRNSLVPWYSLCLINWRYQYLLMQSRTTGAKLKRL